MQITRSGSTIALGEKGATITIEPNTAVEIKSTDTMRIDWPGEYEVQGVTVRAYPAESGLSLLVGSNDIRLFMPAESPLQLTEDDLEELSNFEILCVAAESSSWEAKAWKKFIEDIEPRIIIFTEDGDTTEKLRKELGAENVERVDSCEVSSKNLPSDAMRFVMLTER